MLKQILKPLYFYDKEGVSTNWAHAGSKIYINSKDIDHPQYVPIVVIYGKYSYSWADVEREDDGTYFFIMPDLGETGWYNMKILTRKGSSDFSPMHYFQELPEFFYSPNHQ